MPHTVPPGPGDGQESLLHLFYRFLWPYQYFRDVTRGDELQRRLNYHHNRAMRVYLPGFAVKWGTLTALWFLAGSILDRWPDFVLPVAGCFIVGTTSMVIALTLLVSYAWLNRFSDPC